VSFAVTDKPAENIYYLTGNIFLDKSQLLCYLLGNIFKEQQRNEDNAREEKRLQISYDSKKIEALFTDLSDVANSKNLLQQEVGLELAKYAKKRKDNLLAFPSFFALVNSKCFGIHSLKGDLKSCYSLSLTGNYRLIIKPACDDLSPESLKKCDTVIIKGIVDYHGEQGNNWLIP